MANVCEQWEAAFRAALASSTRRVVLRFGLVLGLDDVALPVLARLARWGSAAPSVAGASTWAGSTSTISSLSSSAQSARTE